MIQPPEARWYTGPWQSTIRTATDLWRRVYMSEYLFPQRLTRRDFCRATATGVAAGLTLGGARSAGATAPVKFGSGKYTYTLDEAWGKLPQGMVYGYGCAVVADG